MNKKFLSVVLFGALMAGSSVTFTGCIDNDEPTGITTLRNAKAVLLEAKAAVQTANAAYRNAETQWMQAQVAYQGLVNDSVSLRNQILAVELKLAEASAEVDQQKFSNQLDSLKSQAEITAMQMEEKILLQKQSLAHAEKAYEDAMKALELSKTYLSSAELYQLAVVQQNLANAKAAVYGGAIYEIKRTVTYSKDGATYYTYALEKVGGPDIKGAQADLQTAYDKYKGKVENASSYINKDSLQADLVDAEGKLLKVQNKLTLKEEQLAALKSDDAYTAWMALKAKYEARIDSVNAVLADKKTDSVKIVRENLNGAIATLEKAVLKLEDENATTGASHEALVTGIKQKNIGDKDSTFEASTAIATDLATLAGGSANPFKKFLAYNNGNIYAAFANYGKTFVPATNEFSTGSVTNMLAVAKKDSKKVTDKYSTGTNLSEDFYTTLLDNTYAFADGKKENGSKYDYTQVVEEIDNAVKEVNKLKAAIPSLDTEKAEGLKKAAKDNLDKANEAKTKGVTAWKNSITAWKTAEGYTTEDEDKKALQETALKAYNDAMTAANKIVDATEKAKAVLKAQQTFADAIVKYYNDAAPLQLTSNKVSLKVTVGSKDTWLSKTVKEWLSDSENKDVYLAALITYFNGDLAKFWTVGKAEEAKAGEEPTKIAEGALATLKTRDEIKDAWKAASQTLFGYTLGVNTYGEGRETEPTEAEIKDTWNKSTSASADTNPAGLCGVVLTREVELTKETDNVEKAAQYDKVVAQLTSWKASLAKAKADFMADEDNKALLDAVTAAQADVKAKVIDQIAALKMDADKALLADLKLVVSGISTTTGDKDDIKEFESLISDLEKEIDGTPAQGSTPAVLGLKEQVKDAAKLVLKAQKSLELYEAGNLKEQYIIEWAEEELALAKADYESKVAIFNYWNAKLKEVTETLYGKASAE